VIEAPDAEPDLNLITDWEPYVNADVAIAPRTVNYVTAEGCHRRCTFCSEPATGAGAWYVRPMQRSVEVITDMVARAGADGVKLHDPNFFHAADRAGLFADLFAAQVRLPWAASLHPADLIAYNDQALHRLAGAGLRRVLMGLESPVPALVRLAGKRYDPALIPTMAARLAAAGIRGMFTFIVGWPGADPLHYQSTIDAAFGIRDIWDEHQCKIHFLEPWPGTPIHTMVTRQGFTYPDTLAGWAQIDYYHAQYAQLHDPHYTAVVRAANAQLSPYVNA
jgi:anaerobic magnesium-protoporphyrin IX monomethyl ester cyclase